MQAAPSRNGGIDAIRVLLTMLVILHHAAIGYGGAGGWFWREEPEASSDFLVIFNAINQAFFMGLFFLLSGYYTPGSYERKQAAHFLADRLLRLGVPLLVFCFVLHPLTVAIARTGEGHPLIRGWWEMTEAGIFGPGPLWFAIALLIFAFGYTGWQVARRGLGWPELSVQALPSPRNLAFAAVGLGLLSFIVRLAIPVGEQWLWLQLGYFPCYIFLFVAGCAAARDRLLERLISREVIPWLVISLAAIATLPIMLVKRGPTGGFEGGWNLNALYYALWDPLVAFGVILGLFLAADRWGGSPTPVMSWLARGAFGAFIIHPPVLVALSVLAMPFAESPLVKFITVGTAACAGSFLVSAALRALPGVRQIL